MANFRFAFHVSCGRNRKRSKGKSPIIQRTRSKRPQDFTYILEPFTIPFAMAPYLSYPNSGFSYMVILILYFIISSKLWTGCSMSCGMGLFENVWK